MRIYTRIVLGLALMGLLVVVGSAYAFLAAENMAETVRRIVSQEIPALGRLDRFQSLIAEVHALETQILSEDLPERRGPFDQKIAEMTALLNDLMPLPYGYESYASLREFRQEARTLIAVEQQIIALQQANELFEARQLATDLIEVRLRVLDRCSRLVKIYRTFIEDKEGQNLGQLTRMCDIVRTYAVLTLLVTLLLMISSVRSVLSPLQQLVKVTQRISRGNLDERADARRPDEFGQLGRAFNMMVDSLRQRLDEVAAMVGILRDADRDHQRQLSLAQNVQKSIVPRNVKIPGLDVYGRIDAARVIGGDFYDVALLTEEGVDRRGRRPCVGLVVGDASGNGIPAALMMVLTMTLLREASRQTTDPRVILEQVNRGMREQFPNELIETFVTASYAVVDLETRRLRFASAGNEPPILRRARDGSVMAVETEGMFLGTFEDSRYEILEMVLEPGDKLILFSDGVTESRAPDGVFFGRDRLEALVREYGHEPVRDLGDRILLTIQDFSQDPTPRDDVALLLAEIEEEA